MHELPELYEAINRSSDLDDYEQVIEELDQRPPETRRYASRLIEYFEEAITDNPRLLRIFIAQSITAAYVRDEHRRATNN